MSSAIWRGRRRGLASSSSSARAGAARDIGESRSDEGFWVAVLPLNKYNGGNAESDRAGGGSQRRHRHRHVALLLSERVYRAHIDCPLCQRIGRRCGPSAKNSGARYVMEGTLRQAGTKLRLLPSNSWMRTTGAHLWAETYERGSLIRKRFLNCRDELVPRIVSTVADTHGVLPYSMKRDAAHAKSGTVDSVRSGDSAGFAYYQRLNAEEHAQARAGIGAGRGAGSGQAAGLLGHALAVVPRRVHTRIRSPA